MFGTIESTNGKITEKISRVKLALESLHTMAILLRDVASMRAGKKYTECVATIDTLHINLTIDALETLESGYNLSIISVLGEYYESSENEEKKTRDYYRIITSENFIPRVNDLISKAKSIICAMQKILQIHLLAKPETKKLEYQLNDIMRDVDNAHNIEITTALEKRNYEVCKCGSRMIVVPELSELHCPNCSKIKTIIGAVFRDDQFYPQEGQKTKHGGYDTGRHYRFWIERLQALESKAFDETTLKKIEYVLDRDGYDRKTLTCENIREILKDSKVAATSLNDHAPLLVKMFGGPAPPQLTFQEHRILSIRFNKAMMLYDIVNPDSGNKPYYPYFIYKIVEHEFRNNPEKLRLLDYIHLQSRETVIKNDKAYEQICALSDDGLVYTPTQPHDRL